MASKTQDTLFEQFQALTAGLAQATEIAFDSEQPAAMALETFSAHFRAAQVNSGTPLVSPLIGLASAPSGAGNTTPAGLPVESSSGVGNAAPSPQPPGSSSDVGSTVLSIASKVFGSGLGLVPLISGLFDLFGGGGASTPPPLVKYAMPERQYFTGAAAGNGFVQADYDQSGMPRLYNVLAGSGALGSALAAPNPSGSTAANPISQINVNVQAMDARSFLDHSNEIAQAVRYAMLNLSSINDVVNDL
jgi:hypothetical protein